MRKTTFVFLIVLSILFAASCKKKNQKATVIKDCSGTYIRLNDVDHMVCNEDRLDSFDPGTEVEVKFVRDDKCVSDRVHCMMVHEHKTEPGNYKILSVK